MRRSMIYQEDTMHSLRPWIVAVFALPVCLLCGSRPALADVIIDFSALRDGPSDNSDFFADLGVSFRRPLELGFVQGDDAVLVGSLGALAGDFARRATSVSAFVAPAFQGTADYTLAALDASSHLIASTTIRITQDIGDPLDTGPGYVPIRLGTLSQPVQAFSLSSEFVGSSFPQVRFIDFGVSSLQFSPVPEPGSLFLFLGGGAALLWRRAGSPLK